MAARFRAGTCRVHSGLVSFGRRVQRRKVNCPSPVNPPHKGTLSPNWMPYRFKVSKDGSIFSDFCIHM